MAKYLSNLKTVEIKHCDGIEEVISSRDKKSENEENTTFFPHLDTLELTDLPSLKHNINDESQSGQVIDDSWLFYQYPKKITIRSCDALSSLIPSYAVGQMKRLQELEVWDCRTMTEIFECESSTNNNFDEGSAHGVGATLTSPTPKTTIPTLVVVPQLFNLKVLSIIGCNHLSHVFSFSTLESLKQLKELRVTSCKAIHVIVKEENETSPKDVVFPRLERLVLYNLPNLKCFFLGVNDFKWPALDDVMIEDCPQLMMFTSGHSKTPKLKYISTGLGKHDLEESCGLNFHGTINEYDQTTFPETSSSSDPTISKGVLPCSFHNLIEIDIKDWFSRRTHAIPSHALLQLQKLEKIHLGIFYMGEEVFEVVALLEGINNSSGFNESQTPIVKVPNLRQVNLRRVNLLKYLWKSNQWMVLEFPNLTTVNIWGCEKLEHVFTCSMVGSLVQLQHLSISFCENIEVIVKEEDKKECDGKVNENIIMLPRLKSLTLNNLSSLKGFCLGKEAFSLSALDTLEIERCPAITCFTKGYLSTPELKVIDTRLGKYYAKPDLNSFIKNKQEEEYEF
ncbi:hypothetical protein SSX86_015832 [Deinandra increscens subsp. villosa]|uniref:Disease resistance protein At4g27190-like leucine-rich repeats domain-containing protein n=1 Tax=Deinandra increscens subsp. villosa TaxID=3103831 RepID=A0AAP0CWS7_9ASTR